MPSPSGSSQVGRHSHSDSPFGNDPDTGVSASDTALLIVSGAGFIFLAVTIYSIVLTKLKSSAEIEEEERELNYNEEIANADVSTLNRAQRRARARHIMKQQRRITLAPGAPGAPEEIAENEQAQVDGKSQLSRKERQKAAKAAEKEERRLYKIKSNRRRKELAAKFGSTENEVERRIQEVLDSSRLTGILDGGKFIYLSIQEMVDIASFVIRLPWCGFRIKSRNT